MPPPNVHAPFEPTGDQPTAISQLDGSVKDKAFARAVPREMLLAGAAEIGLEFDDHVSNMARYLGVVAPEGGL